MHTIQKESLALPLEGGRGLLLPSPASVRLSGVTLPRLPPACSSLFVCMFGWVGCFPHLPCPPSSPTFLSCSLSPTDESGSKQTATFRSNFAPSCMRRSVLLMLSFSCTTLRITFACPAREKRFCFGRCFVGEWPCVRTRRSTDKQQQGVELRQRDTYICRTSGPSSSLTCTAFGSRAL